MMEATAFETRESPWWLLLLGGILNIIIGFLLLTMPGKTVLAMVWVLGLYWFIQGIFTLIAMFIDHSAWGWKLFVGVLSILAGIVVLRHPIASAVTIPSVLVLMLGIQGLVVGAVSLVFAFKGGGWGAGILGALSIVFGIILCLDFANLGTIVAFVWIVGVVAIFGGTLQIIQSLGQRNA